MTTPIPRDRRPRTTSPSMASSSGTDEGGSLRFRGRGKDFFDRSIFGPRCRCQSRPGWRGSRSRPRESAPPKGAGFWRRSPRESDPGCTSRQCAEPRRRYRRCKAGPCGSLAISQSGCRYRHGGHFLRSILLGVGPFSDSVDGSNDRSGVFYREYVDRPGTAEKRLRANQPHGCRLPTIDAQYPCQYSVQVRDAP